MLACTYIEKMYDNIAFITLHARLPQRKLFLHPQLSFTAHNFLLRALRKARGAWTSRPALRTGSRGYASRRITRNRAITPSHSITYQRAGTAPAIRFTRRHSASTVTLRRRVRRFPRSCRATSSSCRAPGSCSANASCTTCSPTAAPLRFRYSRSRGMVNVTSSGVAKRGILLRTLRSDVFQRH